MAKTLTPRTQTRRHAEQLSEPQRIRMQAAELVRQDKLAQAEQLTARALAQYPDSQDVLAIRALILEVLQDWTAARQTLHRLLKVQGDTAPADTWCHWVRVLRCEGMARQAMEAASDGLVHHPQHPALSAELQALQWDSAHAAQGVSTSLQP